MTKNQDFLVDVTPDVRLLRVLRNSGFNIQTAMGELLDNSVDAGANEIEIYAYLGDNNKKNVMIVDNGKGMTEENVASSLTLAKEMKTGIEQLGKYGMGMKTAALSLSSQFEIYTKAATSKEVTYAEFNINKMEQLNEFKTTVRRAEEFEMDFFFSKLGRRAKSGTVFVIKNCDRLDVSTSTFAKQMRSYIGLTYRNHINKNIKFYSSDFLKKGDPIKPIDPLMRENDNTDLMMEREAFSVEYTDVYGKKEKTLIEVSAAILPVGEDGGKVVDGKPVLLPLNQTNQGIYFYREGRMVGSALAWNNVFGEKHNEKNRFRIEINCKSILDNEIKMNFQKGNVSPTLSLKNQLSDYITPIVNEMRRKLFSDSIDKAISTAGAEVLSISETPKPISRIEEKREVEVQTNSVKIPKKELEVPGSLSLKLDTKSNKKKNKIKTNDEKELELLDYAKKIGEILNHEDTPEWRKQHILSALNISYEVESVG